MHELISRLTPLWITSFLAVFVFVDLNNTIKASEAPSSGYFREVEDNAVGMYAEFETLFRQFIQIVEANLELRRSAKMIFKKMDNKLRSDEHLTSADQQALKREFTRYRINRRALERFISAFQVYSDENVTLVFPATQSSNTLEKEKFLGLTSNTEVYVNPRDDLGRLMILQMKMWLASKLLIFDNYIVVLVRYRKVRLG